MHTAILTRVCQRFIASINNGTHPGSGRRNRVIHFVRTLGKMVAALFVYHPRSHQDLPGNKEGNQRVGHSHKIRGAMQKIVFVAAARVSLGVAVIL